MSWFKKSKFYEEVKCLSCDGTGKKPQATLKNYYPFNESEHEKTMKVLQGICLGCNGKGTQTVLEHEE
jgi:RecJ-like exonuclease